MFCGVLTNIQNSQGKTGKNAQQKGVFSFLFGDFVVRFSYE